MDCGTLSYLRYSELTDVICVMQLDDLRELVRQPLSRIGRQVLSALIVIEVHAREVVMNMIKESVRNINDFEWISQLRYTTNREGKK